MKKNIFNFNVFVLSTFVAATASADLSTMSNFVNPGRIEFLDRSSNTKTEQFDVKKKLNKSNFNEESYEFQKTERLNKNLREPQGGVNGGGGNSIDGRLIESYVKNIENIDGYKEVIVPVLNHLSMELPGFAYLLKSTVERTTWYIVPKSLKARSEDITGLPFPSDQTAVQGDLEVFIDREKFQELFKIAGKQEQGRLLLHELIMASIQVSCTLRNEADPFACIWGIDQSKMHTVTRKTVNFLLRNPNADQNALINGLKEAGWMY
jgi:hypothetical protein